MYREPLTGSPPRSAPSSRETTGEHRTSATSRCCSPTRRARSPRARSPSTALDATQPCERAHVLGLVCNDALVDSVAVPSAATCSPVLGVDLPRRYDAFVAKTRRGPSITSTARERRRHALTAGWLRSKVNQVCWSAAAGRPLSRPRAAVRRRLRSSPLRLSGGRMQNRRDRRTTSSSSGSWSSSTSPRWRDPSLQRLAVGVDLKVITGDSEQSRSPCVRTRRRGDGFVDGQRGRGHGRCRLRGASTTTVSRAMGPDEGESFGYNGPWVPTCASLGRRERRTRTHRRRRHLRRSGTRVSRRR